jgi:hypothetical protein
MVHVHRSKRLPHGGTLSDEDRHQLGQQWADALTAGRRITGPMIRTPEAARVWDAWYHSIPDDVHGMYGKMVARAESHVLRLSMIYALLDGTRQIRVEHVHAALAFWQFCDASVRRLYPPALTGDHDADRLLQAMRERGSLSRSECSYVFSGHRGADRLEAALKLLMRSGHIVESVEPTSGRSRRLYTFIGG